MQAGCGGGFASIGLIWCNVVLTPLVAIVSSIGKQGVVAVAVVAAIGTVHMTAPLQYQGCS